MLSPRIKAALGVGALVAAGIAVAPLAEQAASADQSPVPQAPAAAAPAPFDAVVMLDNCSASLVRFAESKDTDKALVLTNAHCVPQSAGGDPAAGKAHVDKKLDLKGVVLHGDRAQEKGEITIDRLVYATSTSTDVALMRTTITYAEAKEKLGTTARTIRKERVAAGAELLSPSGFWRHDFRCKVGGIVPTLLEGKWTWKDSIKYEGECGGYKGTSGAPLTDPATGDIVGINNTGSMKGEMCTVDNPCEVDEKGNKTATKGQSYGQQVDGLAKCVSPEGTFDLKTPGCPMTGAPSPATKSNAKPDEVAGNAYLTPEPDGQGIINGRNSTTTDGVVAFIYRGGPVCTGSLIAPDVVLSAKHCTGFSTDPAVLAVRIGSLRSDRGGFLVPAKTIAMKNDVLVMKLAWTSYSDEKPVTLASADPAEGEKTLAKGFGLTSSEIGKGRDNTLNETDVTVKSLKAIDYHGGPAFSVVGDKTSPYQGDSGGPLFNSKGEQVGVVSTGVIKEWLANYGSVARNLDWIKAEAGL